MLSSITFRGSISSFVFLFLFTLSLSAQDTTGNIENFSIKTGTIFTGFSVDGITASRDSYNHEFERAFSRLRFHLEGLYFVNNQVGIGPTLGYQYQFRDFEDSSGIPGPGDQWTWDFLYGVKAGYYVSASKILASEVFRESYFFVNGGINWLRNQRKIRNIGKLDPNHRFGYTVETGLLIPMGRRISLEWKLGWNGRRQDYTFAIIENGQPIGRENETKWLKELSLGLGLKVAL